MQANSVDTQASRSSIGPVQIAIIVLTIATAAIHLYLVKELVAAGMSGWMFILNGLGYLSLLAALFLPVPIFLRYRSVIRILLMLFTLVTILGWVFMGARSIWGYTDKAIEIALLVCLWLDRSRK